MGRGCISEAKLLVQDLSKEESGRIVGRLDY